MRTRKVSIPGKAAIDKMSAKRAGDLLRLLTGLSAPAAKKACKHLRNRLMELESKER